MIAATKKMTLAVWTNLSFDFGLVFAILRLSLPLCGVTGEKLPGCRVLFSRYDLLSK